MGGQKLETLDFVAVGIYFTAVIGVGIFSMCRANRGTVTGYFLAGRYMIWLPVGASLFASNIGSEHFIGLAGSGAAAGIGVGAFELNALIMLQLLGWIFLPVYIASGVCTLPEFMKKRFGGNRIRIYLTTLSLVLYIFTKISVNLYSGALFIQQALQWDLYVAILLILAVTAFCTVTGGLTAVIYTDTLQTVIMVIGASTLSIIGFKEVGGITGLYEKYQLAIPNTTLANPNTTCGYPRDDSWIMLRDPVNSDIPWPGFLFGQTPASIWYWCADQMMVQRALAAKSLSHAQGGTLFAGYLKLLPLFIMVMPGMISRVLYADEVACADPDICTQVCGNPVGCSNIAYPKIVLELLPVGMRGVMLSVMLAALMSDLTSIFNSASTLFTMDIYRIIRKKASVRELMIVGRGFVCVMIVIGILWIPAVQSMQGAQLYLYIQSIAAYLSPPIAAVYCVSLFWKRANEQGAFWGLMMGMVVGVTRMVLDFAYPDVACGEIDTRPAIVAKVHYMYFATILFWVTVIAMIILSLLTSPPTEEQTIRTTYWTRHDRRGRDDETIQTTDTVVNRMDSASAPGIESGVENLNYKTEDSGDPNDIALQETPGSTPGSPSRTPLHARREKKSFGELAKLFLRRLVHGFCGFEEGEDALKTEQQQVAHLLKMSSLKQDPKAKIFLNVNLVILVIICIGLYILFSVDNWVY